MLTLVTMGRRGKTNCSPVDSALEKYHNDIGNRLSGVFLPPPPAHPCCATTATTNSNKDGAIEDSTCDAFSMLTLDFRGKHGVKHTTTPATCHHKSSTMPTLLNTRKDNNNNIDESSSETDSLHQKDDSAFDQNTPSPHSTHNPGRSHTLPAYTTSPQSNGFSNNGTTVSSSKGRPNNIMDKLARAIFQRKHTCARCQRRSRSCLQNKTFTVHEKHYTCARCRETSRAFKNLVTGQESKSHNNSSNDDKEDDTVDDIILRKPRLQLKDSGYETVTSCSTVASAHSNSNSPYASANRQHQQQHNHIADSSNPCGATTSTATPAPTSEFLRVSPAPATTPSEVDHEVDELIRKANHGTTVSPYLSGHRDNNSTTVTAGNPHQHHHHNHHHHCHHHPDSSHPTHDYVNVNFINSGIEQYLGGVGDQGCRVLKQVKTRFVQDYDGYLNLPTSEHHAHNTASDDEGYCNCGDHSHPNCDIVTNSTHVKSSNPTNKPSPKMCHVCETTSRPCFRLPWEGGWLCEECIDGML